MNRKLIQLRATGAICLAATLWSATAAHAAVTVTMTESGPNVVASYSGSLDVTGLTLLGPATGSSAYLNASSGTIAVGPSSMVWSTPVYSGLVGPTSIGSGSFQYANSGTGTLIELSPSMGRLYVSPTFVSGAAISGSSTWNSKTFSSLGLTPGSYVYNLGADTVTLNITAAVPEPSAGWLLLAGLGVVGATAGRRSAKARR